MISSDTVLKTSIFLLVLFVIRQISKKKPPAPLPPGPKGLPFVGNALNMPMERPWLKFASWKAQYGDIVYVNVMGQPYLIVHSAKVAIEMLDKKSSIYSDRPVLPMGGEIVGWNQFLALIPYGPRFREHRRYLRRVIGSKVKVEEHAALISDETRDFLRRITRRGSDLAANIRRSSGAIMLKLAYGYQVQDTSDHLLHLVDQTMDTLVLATTPGVWLVDLFPILRYVPQWFPGATFQKKGAEWRRILMDTAHIPYEMVKENMKAKSNTHNFTAELLETENLNPETEFNIKWSASSLYAGGADTTVSAVHSFFLAMCLFPDVQKRAQAEIDRVIGNDRMPTLEDQPRLPYVSAVVLEILRWQPVAPLGLPHRVMEDDIHDGYFVPKGSVILVNIWSILRDPDVYPNPEIFDPTRYIAEPGKPAAQDPRIACFGFGRRICPGNAFADTSLFLTLAMTLAVCDISKATANGQVVDPVIEYSSGAVSHPKPFNCVIKPRSERAEALIPAIQQRKEQGS